MQYELPNSLDTERAVLGACLISREATGTAAAILKPEDFYDTSNRAVWHAISEQYSQGKIFDVATLADELQRQGILDRIGGKSYLLELMHSVTLTANVGYHAEILRDYARRRRFIEASEKIAKVSVNYELDGKELVAEIERIIFEATESKDSSLPAGMSELAPLAFERVKDAYSKPSKEFTGYSSGLADLDKIVAGFQPGSLNIIAARPSMGKTALAMNIAQFGGGDNPCVLVFSLEMPAQQLVLRMFAAEAEVSVSAMNRGMFDAVDYQNLMDAEETLERKHIFIEDASDLTITDFRTTCRRFKIVHPELALIIVDYIQLMRSGNKRSDNRQNEVSEISRAMKATALEMNCPIIALSQLSRETEKRTDKKPQLWDLRDSGAIEQDADVVMMLYREDYYSEHENNDLMDSKADVRIAKNRNGATGICHLTFKREYTKFVGFAEG